MSSSLEFGTIAAEMAPEDVEGVFCNRRDVVWTHNDVPLRSTAVAGRKAMTPLQQDSRMSVRETQSKDLTAKG